MKEVEIHSTPIIVNQNKKSDENDMFTRLYNMMYNSLEKQDSNFSELRRDINIRFEEQNIKFDVQNSKFNEIYNSFNEITNEIKQQGFDFNQHLKQIDTRFDTITEQILESISSNCEKKLTK